jgi:hypothetical protein
MNFEGNFRYICEFDVSKLQSLIPAESDPIWNMLERHNEYIVHKDTKTIVVNDFDINWNGEGYPSKRMDIGNKELEDEVWNIGEQLSKMFNMRIGRLLLINLKPKSRVYPHIDTGLYLASVKRLHIPIITNDNVFFRVGEEIINMKNGHCTEVNNMRVHGVQNQSDTARIHLLCDLL